MTSDDSDQNTIYEVNNGETFWILITDHFTGMKYGYVRISKAYPIALLRHFLNHYSPTCNEKYTHLDQGIELFNNLDVNKILQSFGCTLRSNGADTSHQNGPVKQSHRTLANSVRAMITGANLDIKFCPYTLYHAI